jgi:hypothetical protein
MDLCRILFSSIWENNVAIYTTPLAPPRPTHSPEAPTPLPIFSREIPHVITFEEKLKLCEKS